MTTIIRVSHDLHHSFVLVSYGESPWIVADPWVAEPYASSLDDNYFDLDGTTSKTKGITRFEEIVVHRRLDVPFGIPSMAPWGVSPDKIQEFHEDSTIKGLGITPKMFAASHDGYNTNHSPAQDMRLDPDTPLFVEEDGKWVANPEALRPHAPGTFSHYKGRPFHCNTPVWEQVSNPRSVEDYWEDGSEFPPPLLLRNEWGKRNDIKRGSPPPPDGPPPKKTGAK